MKPEVHVLPDPEAIFQRAADEFSRLAIEAVKARGVFFVALSGGSTPKGLYTLLVSDPSFRAQVPWDKIHFFFGDERTVPPEHADSNFRMATEAMFSKVTVPAAHIHRVSGEDSLPSRAAAAYEQELRNAFDLSEGQFPRFDLILLGMGPDGHTASLFPGTTALQEKSRLVVANWVEKFKTYRITFTFPVLNNAANILFMAGGAEKAEVLKSVLNNDPAAAPYPSQLVHPQNGRLLWLVEQAATRLWQG